MMIVSHEILEHNDDLYKVLRKIRESHKPLIDVWKEHLGADAVLRAEGFLYFCRKIQEAVIVIDEPAKVEVEKIQEDEPAKIEAEKQTDT